MDCVRNPLSTGINPTGFIAPQATSILNKTKSAQSRHLPTLDSHHRQVHNMAKKPTTHRNRAGLPCRSTVTWEERLATHAADALTASMGDGGFG